MASRPSRNRWGEEGGSANTLQISRELDAGGVDLATAVLRGAEEDGRDRWALARPSPPRDAGLEGGRDFGGDTMANEGVETGARVRGRREGVSGDWLPLGLRGSETEAHDSTLAHVRSSRAVPRDRECCLGRCTGAFLRMGRSAGAAGVDHVAASANGEILHEGEQVTGSEGRLHAHTHT